MTVTDPEWTDTDRGLLLALLAEQADVCPMCGHPMEVCRDPGTSGQWQVIPGTCYPSQVAQIVREELTEKNRRGVVIATKRTILGGADEPQG